MADLKPLGSEKLNGDEKLKRILELTYYNQKNKNINESKPDLVKESLSGGVYGIVKEKDGFYVKKGLTESTLDYIGGMFMKNKNKFSSYAEALKRLELLKGQEELQEATKYVLKTNKPTEEAPAPIPSIDDLPPSDETLPAADDSPSEDLPMDGSSDMSGAPEDGMGGESGKRSDYMAEVQKFAGKLGQELRDQQDRMESDDIKYVLNMIISAVDLDKLDEDDRDEISTKFEPDEEGDIGGDEMDFGDEEPNDEETPNSDEIPSDEELEETINMLDSFVNSSLDEYMDEEEEEEETESFNFDEYSDLEDSSDIYEYRPMYVSPEISEEDNEDEYVIKDEEDLDEEMVPEDDETFEIDLNELRDEINNSINAALGKYTK